MSCNEALNDCLHQQAKAGQPISREDALRWIHQFSREQKIKLIAFLEAMQDNSEVADKVYDFITSTNNAQEEIPA